MPIINDISQLGLYINQLTQEAMSKGISVKNTVIEEGKRQVQTTVYNVYEPKEYSRTGQLKEDWNWQDTPDGIEIINTRTDKDTGKYIVDTVEYGRNYDYEFPYAHTPRPFVENTANKLRDSIELTNALKQDLRDIGVDVE